MRRYVAWLDALPGKPVFVAYPAGFDFLFVYWYPMRLAGRSPFSRSALDMKSIAMAQLRKDYRASSKRNMPKHSLVLSAAAFACRAGRRHGAGRAVLQPARGQPRGRLDPPETTPGGVDHLEDLQLAGKSDVQRGFLKAQREQRERAD